MDSVESRLCEDAGPGDAFKPQLTVLPKAGSAQAPIVLAIIEWNPLLATALADLLGRLKNTFLVGAVGWLDEPPSLEEITGSDVVVVGPGAASAETVGRTRTHARGTPIVALTDDPVRDTAALVRAGATGVGDARSELRVLAAMIDACALGLGVVGVAHIADWAQFERSCLQRLTAEDASLLRALSDAATNRQISERLHLSSRTVRRRLASLYDTLGVPDRAAAVARAQAEYGEGLEEL